MALTTPSIVRRVFGLTPDEESSIKKFVQGAIYSWCKNRKADKFAVRDLVGGVNADWLGTPLYVLYKSRTRTSKTHRAAYKAAGRDLGWLVKDVIVRDKRMFEKSKKGGVAAYHWVHRLSGVRERSVVRTRN